MVEYNSEKKVFTGGVVKDDQLYYALRHSFRTADSNDIIVSFLMESGVKMMLDVMKEVVDAGKRIRILTGNYLGITSPSALYLIKAELGD